MSPEARDPFRRFLGVPETAAASELLRLPGPTRDRLQVETALQRRLEQIHRHPAGRTEEAARVRARVRRAAAVMLEPRDDAVRRVTPARVMAPTATRPAATPGFVPRGGAMVALTEFDRYVLATLVAGGGWNARSRARLVALSATYGVGAAGLIKVICGLGDYARAGGPRIEVAEITSYQPRLAAPISPSRDESPDEFVEAPRRPLIPELTDASLASTVKLSVFFGLLTIVAATLFVRTFVFTGRDVPRPPIAPTAGPRPGRTPADLTPTRTGDADAGVVRPATFRQFPSFLGNALPTQATDAADECPRVIVELDGLTRRLSITDDPSESVFHRWEVALETMSRGWVLVDDSTRRAVEAGIRDALHQTADTPSVGDRLLRPLAPPRGRLAEPLDVWRGAWRAGMLGLLADGATLPTAVLQQARQQLVIALGPAGSTMRSYDAAASAWLDAAVVPLVDALEIDPRMDEFWEMWLAAQQEIGDDHHRQSALLNAITRVLETRTDLAREGPSVNVLGRLLLRLEMERGIVARDGLETLFDRPEDEITSHDLWVLTSLLRQMDSAPWFGPDLVLPADAGSAFRSRIRDRILAQWPALPDHAPSAELAQGRRLQIDSRAGVRWRSLLDRIPTALDAIDETRRVETLIVAARLNEAAVLLAARRRAEADAVMDDVEKRLGEWQSAAGATGASGGGARGGAPRRGGGAAGAGQPRGRDGVWAEAYEEARRNTEEKLGALQGLRAQAGTDLGPLDAEEFVREVYRGAPQDVRTLARAILVEHFSAGPNVAMEMLDRLPNASRNEQVSEVIRRLTGRLLPSARSEAWEREARLALVEHALSLRRSGPSEIDRQSDKLLETIADRAATLRRSTTTRATVRTPQAAAEELATAWQERARLTIASVTVPGDLTDLSRRQATRRQLTEGPVQLYVAALITSLEHAAYVTVGEQPGVRDAAVEILGETAKRRRHANHVVTQAVETERGLGYMWALRMGLDAGDGEPAAGASGDVPRNRPAGQGDSG